MQELVIVAPPNPNDVRIKDASLILLNQGVRTGQLTSRAHAIFGAKNIPGKLYLVGTDGKTRRAYLDGEFGNLWLGGNGQDGDLVIFSKTTTTDFTNASSAAIHLDGDNKSILIRHGGGLEIRSVSGDRQATLRASSAGGELTLRNDIGNATLKAVGEGGEGAKLTVGTQSTAGKVVVKNQQGKSTIKLDGEAGDVILANGDCAEDFEIEESAELEPGSVAVLNDEARIEECRSAYDRRVVGIVAGAGDFKPGIILGRRGDSARHLPVALMGKVFCKADARRQPIGVGDILTSSRTPGHAMKATDRDLTAGATIGKALGPLASGQGLIPVLTTLR